MLKLNIDTNLDRVFWMIAVFSPQGQSCKFKKLELRLVRPWILFPYKSLKSEIALTLKLLLLWLSNCRKFLVFGCSFTWCKLLILFVFAYDKNKDTPFCIGSVGYADLWGNMSSGQRSWSKSLSEKIGSQWWRLVVVQSEYLLCFSIKLVCQPVLHPMNAAWRRRGKHQRQTAEVH